MQQQLPINFNLLHLAEAMPSRTNKMCHQTSDKSLDGRHRATCCASTTTNKLTYGLRSRQRPAPRTSANSSYKSSSGQLLLDTRASKLESFVSTSRMPNIITTTTHSSDSSGHCQSNDNPLNNLLPKLTTTRRKQFVMLPLFLISLSIVALMATLAVSSNSLQYQYPIHQNLPRLHQQFRQNIVNHINNFNNNNNQLQSSNQQPAERRQGMMLEDSASVQQHSDAHSTQAANTNYGPNAYYASDMSLDRVDNPTNEQSNMRQEQQQQERETQNQLRQLHQVVDTVAELLNQEDEHQKRSGRSTVGVAPVARDLRAQQSSPDVLTASIVSAADSIDRNGVDQLNGQQSSSNNNNGEEQSKFAGLPADLMSESALRQALEELERVQQQERQEAISAASSPSTAPSQEPSSADVSSHSSRRSEFNYRNNARNSDDVIGRDAPRASSTIESLIEELSDELIDDQLTAATQEAERLIQNQHQQDQSNRQEPASYDQQRRLAGAEMIAQSTTVPSNSTTMSPSTPTSLMVGQLESSSGDLGPSLTNDFYTFHADSIGVKPAERAEKNVRQISAANEANSNNKLQAPGERIALNANQRKYTSDLESAAQTRDIISHNSNDQLSAQLNGYNQNQQPRSLSSLTRFDFSQPVQFERPELVSSPRPFPSQNVNVDGGANLLGQPFGRAEESLAPNADQGNQFQASTLQPNTDNFWRPAASSDESQLQNNNRNKNNDFLNQALPPFGNPQQELPPLPPSRFQSLSPQPPSGSQLRQPVEHVHFTGHSFISSPDGRLPAASQFGQPPPPPPPPPAQPQQSQSRDRAQVGNFGQQSPIISVVSGGSGTTGSNSVTWNPPPLPPAPPQNAQQFFNQQHFASSNAQVPSSSPAPSNQFSQVDPNSGNNSQDGPESDSEQPPASFVTTSNPLGGPASPLYRGAFQNVPSSQSQEQRRPASNSDSNRFGAFNNFAENREHGSGRHELTTEDIRAPMTVNTRTITSSTTAASLSSIAERDLANSRPRSTRPSQSEASRQQDNFYSQEDPIARGPQTPPSSAGQSAGDVRALRSSSSQLYSETSASSTRSPPLMSSSTPASLVTTTPATNATNKDDTVIYYYYYYDDNKNATVVAKNISATAAAGSSTSATPLDAAIEADAGIEDTPYMDDPAPLANSRPASSFKPSSAQAPPKLATTTTSTTTTSTTPFSVSTPSQYSSTARSEARLNRLPVATNEYTTPASRLRGDVSSTQSSIARGRDQHDSTSHLNPRLNFKHSSNDLASSTHSSAGPQAVFSSTQPTIVSPQQPASRQTQQSSHGNDQIVGHNRFVSSDALAPSTSSSSSSQGHSRLTGTSHSSFAHRNPSVTTLSPVSSSTSTTSATRTSLSNASRYGTSNNMALDPYGIDSTAHEGPLAHPTGSTATADSVGAQNHRTWPQTSSAQSASSNQFGRKPQVVTAAPVAIPVSTSVPTRVDSSGDTMRTNRQFSAQRNQVEPISRLPNSSPPQVTAITQPKRQTNLRPQEPSNTNSLLSAVRQVFPESNVPASKPSARPLDQRELNKFAQPTQAPAIQSVPSSTPQTFSSTRLIPQARLASTTSTTTSMSVGPSDNGRHSDTDSDSQAPRSSSSFSNGRPTTSDGNTGNGFTRSPLPSIATSPATPTINNLQRELGTTNGRVSLLSSFTSSPISTSVSRSFLTPQQVQVTTSVSPPSTTSTSVSTTSSTTSVSMSSSLPVSQPTITTTTTTTSTTTTTPAPMSDGALTTESSDSGSASTRRKFGNRNNRFQTRLSATRLGAATSSSTTTPAPSSTTTSTRRPYVSTTRKSNRQLFTGRRRLGSSSLPASGPVTEPTPTQAAPSSTTATFDQNGSTTSTSSSSTQLSASRAKFGNSFTPRTRSTTSSPTTGSESQAATSSQRPSLFNSQKVTARPRLPFMKSTKPSATTNSESTEPQSDSGTLASGVITAETNIPLDGDSDSSKLTTKPQTGSGESSTSLDNSSSTSTSSEPAQMSRETSASDQSQPTLADMSMTNAARDVPPNPTTTTSTTSAPTSTTEQQVGSGRNKPRVRPLFASRQRSSNLFGNRKNNETSTTT